MKANPLLELETLGQSIWIDFIGRGMLASGGLRKLIEGDGVSGVTSNPTIFEKAIAGSHDYDEAIRALSLDGKRIDEIYQVLTVEDIRRTADLLRPTYDRLDGGDGFASLEVSPRLAHDTAATMAEARRLWTTVGRPNVMIKVPATLEGLPAIRQLTAEGINVNATLLFGLPRYRQVAEAYLEGLGALAAGGRSLDRVVSVASFFLSRIDVLIDTMLENPLQTGGPNVATAAAVQGQVAIASAKVAYQMYQEIFSVERFGKLAAQGARAQRLLWASTSTKNPAYSDVKYVEPLIGPQTVNTLPLQTLSAYRDHGRPALRLEEGVGEARRVLERLQQLGNDLGAVTQQLEDEAVKKFLDDFDLLMSTLKAKSARS